MSTKDWIRFIWYTAITFAPAFTIIVTFSTIGIHTYMLLVMVSLMMASTITICSKINGAIIVTFVPTEVESDTTQEDKK